MTKKSFILGLQPANTFTIRPPDDAWGQDMLAFQADIGQSNDIEQTCVGLTS